VWSKWNNKSYSAIEHLLEPGGELELEWKALNDASASSDPPATPPAKQITSPPPENV
jgi:hypothetical protein